MNLLFQYGTWCPENKDAGYSRARRNKLTGAISLWSSGESLYEELFGTWTNVNDCGSIERPGKFVPDIDENGVKK